MRAETGMCVWRVWSTKCTRGFIPSVPGCEWVPQKVLGRVHSSVLDMKTSATCKEHCCLPRPGGCVQGWRLASDAFGKAHCWLGSLWGFCLFLTVEKSFFVYFSELSSHHEMQQLHILFSLQQPAVKPKSQGGGRLGSQAADQSRQQRIMFQLPPLPHLDQDLASQQQPVRRHVPSPCKYSAVEACLFPSCFKQGFGCACLPKGNTQPGQQHGTGYNLTAQELSSVGNRQSICLAYSLSLHQASCGEPNTQSLVFFLPKSLNWYKTLSHNGILVWCGLWLEEDKGSVKAF